MAIGLSVDYCVHIAHAFSEVHSHAVAAAAPGERVSTIDSAAYALTTMGASVIKGGFTTILGIFVIAFASSVVFRTFFTLICFTVILGLLHGMCLMPVLLAYGSIAACAGHCAKRPPADAAEVEGSGTGSKMSAYAS
jgi:predicted RND superfamily exporter protein